MTVFKPVVHILYIHCAINLINMFDCRFFKWVGKKRLDAKNKMKFRKNVSAMHNDLYMRHTDYRCHDDVKIRLGEDDVTIDPGNVLARCLNDVILKWRAAKSKCSSQEEQFSLFCVQNFINKRLFHSSRYFHTTWPVLTHPSHILCQSQSPPHPFGHGSRQVHVWDQLVVVG